MAFDQNSSGAVDGGTDTQLQQLIATLQSAVQAVNGLNETINATLQDVFPQQGATESTATAGVATLPAKPQTFLVIVVNGTTYKVPLYLP